MGEYLRLTERRSYNFLLGLVLLALYEAFVFLFVDVRELDRMNLIDRLFDELLLTANLPLVWVSAILAVLAVGFILADLKDGAPLKFWVLGAMLLESLAWAGVLFLMLPYLTAEVMSASAAPQLPNSLEDSNDLLTSLGLAFGAGFYEEFFFRYVLVKLLLGLFALMTPALPRPGRQGLTILLTALLFSATHLLVEDFDAYRFAYRALFGLVMSALFVVRRFGITAWSHAFYDVLVFTLV